MASIDMPSFLNYKDCMPIKRLILSLVLVALLAGCTFGPVVAPPAPPTPTLLPGVTPSDTPEPTFTQTATVEPEVRISNADLALRNGDYSLAQSEYQIALADSTTPQISAAALWGLGQANYQAANYAKADQDLWQLIENYPDAPNRIQAYYLLGEIYMQQERYIEAAQAFTVYVTLRPGVIDYYAHERRGDAFRAAGNYADAIEAFQAALNAEYISDDTSIKIKLAETYALAGDTLTAMGMYDSIAGSSTNDYIKAQMDLLSGQIHLSLDQTDEAYQHYLNSVENYPLAYDSYTMLVELVNAGVPVNDLDRGLVDYFAGQYGFALDAFSRYISANPENDGTALYYSALTLREMGFFTEAISAFSNFISNYSENRYWQSAWDEKAYTLWAYLGLYPEAAQTLLDYGVSDPGNSYVPQTILAAGRVYERAGNLAEAARVWESLADNYPGSESASLALFWAGIAYYRNSQYNDALATFQRAKFFVIDTEEQARAIFWIGKTYLVLGDSASAEAAWQEAAAIDPTDYYSLRAEDMLFDQGVFTTPIAAHLTVDLAADKLEADSWLRVTFGLPTDTDLNGPGTLSADPRLVRGTELWTLGLYDESRLEFEDLRSAVETNAADTYRLMNYLFDLGMYRSAIFAARQVLTLAGMTTQLQTLAAPVYFNHIRYGLYYQDLVFPAAIQNGFEPFFLLSVIRQESLFEGFVRSTAGAHGLMQIIPSTGQYIVDNLGWPPNYTSEDLYRPNVSITLGAYYLKTNRIYFGGDLYAMLAAYNGGPGNAETWLGLTGHDADLFVEAIRYEETRSYIRSIYEIYNMYLSLYEKLP